MRRSVIGGIVAAAAATALVVGASIVWPGLDAKETPDVDAAVWALQTADGRRYARVNTSVGELDTVRSISNPDLVAQSPTGAYVFSDSLSKVTRIDEALPADLDAEALQSSTSTPGGTVDVATADDYVAYLTDAGTVFAGRLSDETIPQVDPTGEDEDEPQYTADAIAVDDRGILFLYSRQDSSVIRYDIAGGVVRARDALTAEGLATPVITAAGDAWAVVDADDGDVWLPGADAAAPTPTTGPVVVGDAQSSGDAVYLADESSVVKVPVDGSAVTTPFGLDVVLGTPARPMVHDGLVYAAWLGQGDGGGTFWPGEGIGQSLDYGDGTLTGQRRPVFVENGESVVLNETRSGWVWTIPDGALVPSSQDWTLDDNIAPAVETSEEQLPVMLDPKPPVAEPDAFGVRAGSLASLPVLMNDHDPNEDVLTIDPASVSGLDPGFGTVSITDSGQRLAVRVAPGASGTATFSYAVTDGTSEGGLVSPPTTVTLAVAPEADNRAPVWCGVADCLLEWPEPEVARDGTVTIPVLPGWVDPDGDPLLLLSAAIVSGGGSAVATPAGDVVYQHSDDGQDGDVIVEIAVTVADTRGAQTQKQLNVRVSSQPQLSVESFAVTEELGSGTTIDVAPHVTGTTGVLSLESVRVLDDAPASATIVGGTTGFDFSPRSSGTYRVDFTLTDGADDASGTVRITVLPEGAVPALTTAPVVAFVRPQEDATIDVFTAVSNPTNRVLLLSDLVPIADPGATMSVDAVGQNHLRVSGTTATGAPGRLGTVRYTVSDGTEDEGASVEGEATVYLLPVAPALAPIAVDDTVAVRAGAQVDIPVLANDISPSGGRPTLDPSSVTSTGDALAFGSGDLVRYLAPDEPGDYTVEYSVFTTGAPLLADTALVRITVLADDANRAPLPETLEGRVLSGQSTSIEFDGFGMDPDGDVVTLDRIVAQPQRGSATIAADGASITYTSIAGDKGPVSFTYRVVDEFGETGQGTVRIGILDAQSNPSPITYTDYVQVQAGATNTIRVSPISNDLDPVGGTLKVTGVRPDAPATLVDGEPNPEYDRLLDRLVAVDDSTVVISAGETPGTLAFLYDVESSSGNTARGLIVVKVVRESVPDYPVVADTILTAETREDFPDGVDVLTGKVAWSGGDIAGLTLETWAPAGDVTADGWELQGSLTAKTRVIPFVVTGTGAAGEVTTYAFLRVPGDDDLTLALRPGFTPPSVEELQSTTFDLARLVARPRGSSLEVGPDVATSGARKNATCTVQSGSVVRYDAGSGAPWGDTCRVAVRLAGQDDWTTLFVPITIRALDPQPELRAGSLTVAPGETATFDLTSMTTWQLRTGWDEIAYDLAYDGTAFDVTRDGSIVTVTGRDRAVPGTDEVALVSVTSHADVAPVRLILRVGAAPSTLARGGVLSQQCSQASGGSCVIDVVGAPGEVNPLPGTPLELFAVSDAGSCVGVTFRVLSASAVEASWTPDAPGATCIASFSLRDAQGRRTNGDRNGTLTLDLLGFPKAPASIAQSAFGDQTLTLRVDPGDARLAYPALTEFVVRTNGVEVARCTAAGVCPALTAPNGEKRVYEAFAVNALGESRASVRTTAWAYDPPAPPRSVTAAPVVTASGVGGVVSLAIEGLDPAKTGSVEITSPAGERMQVALPPGQSRIDVPAYNVGSNAPSVISVTPYSRFDPPPVVGGSPAGPTVTVTANGIGAPLSPVLTLSSVSTGGGRSTVTATASAQLNGTGSTLRFGIVRDDQRCTVRTNGETATFRNLQDGEEYGFTMCVESIALGGVSFGSTSVTQTVRAQQSVQPPTGYTFAVDATPDVGDGRAQWVIRAAPRSDESPPNRNVAEFSGIPSTVFGTDPGIRVRYVHSVWGTATEWATVTPASGSAPYQVQASWSVASCVGGSPLTPVGSSSTDAAGNGASIVFGNADLRYYAGDVPLPHEPGTWTVPAGATRVEGISVTASWNQPWGLSAASSQFAAVCDPGPPAIVEPNP
ncbi:Ig-like domain-containing protein [Microbacterium sp.]|uniref:Ig-like domain-containing protein n=1 Tax=Microbacterium sp. TaxID=51671 RepID=UPI003F715240